MSNEIDFTNHYTALKTMNLSHYEVPQHFMIDMHSQVDALNKELETTKKQLEDCQRLIEEMCVDDCGIDLAKEDRESLESIIMVNDERCREFLAKLNKPLTET